jgi:hypothetical protein
VESARLITLLYLQTYQFLEHNYVNHREGKLAFNHHFENLFLWDRQNPIIKAVPKLYGCMGCL